MGRTVFCTGKVCHDLLHHRREAGVTAIIRIEQLYPFHDERALELVGPHPKAATWVWCQEEPERLARSRKNLPEARPWISCSTPGDRGRLPWHHQDPFGRMLVAQAKLHALQLVSRDRVFAACAVVVLVA